MSQRRRKIFIFTVLGLSLLALVAYDLSYELYLYVQARQGVWYEEKLSKTTFLRVQKRPYQVVFVGSSQTQNQVDTSILAKCHIRAFNLGLPGNLFNEQVYPTQVASELAQEAVVLSVDPRRLFEPLESPRWLTLGEIIFFLRFDRRLLRGMDLTTLLRALAMNRLERFLNRRDDSLPNLDKWADRLKKNYGYDPRRDSRGINYIRGDKDRLVVLYRNGDGQVFADTKSFNPPLEKIDKRGSPFAPEALRYLAALSAMVREHDKRFVVNLAPARANRYMRLDLARLQKKLKHIVFIDTRQKLWPRRYWADIMHLNYQGTRLYGRILCRELNRVLKHGKRQDSCSWPETARPGGDCKAAPPGLEYRSRGATEG